MNVTRKKNEIKYNYNPKPKNYSSALEIINEEANKQSNNYSKKKHMLDNPLHSLNSKAEVFNWNDNIIKSIQEESSQPNNIEGKKNIKNNTSNFMKLIFSPKKEKKIENQELNKNAEVVKNDEFGFSKKKLDQNKNQSSFLIGKCNNNNNNNFNKLNDNNKIFPTQPNKSIQSYTKNDSIEIKNQTSFAGFNKGKVSVDSRIFKIISVKNMNSPSNPLSSYKNAKGEFNYDVNKIIKKKK